MTYNINEEFLAKQVNRPGFAKGPVGLSQSAMAAFSSPAARLNRPTAGWTYKPTSPDFTSSRAKS